ncbi:MAG: EscF/YscF/HrpA family type III secretion system needle major subunit [Symbiopectobacterium sp.]|uniref:EscF/YscF/HrpA family type III secretion system needle major subunit n=1 Tax=Symbiopectobacterium sp. TaxID=2952789 RepID=UPI0039EBD262
MADYTPQHIDNIFFDKMSGEFENGAKTLMNYLNEAKEALTADPSNPSVLAAYQSKLQAYTLFRNA